MVRTNREDSRALRRISQKFRENLNIDWVLVAAIVPLFLAGLISMKGLGPVDEDYFFSRQLIWIGIGFVLFFIASTIDWRFLRNGWLLFGIYSFGVAVLAALLIFARAVRGAQSWIPLGFFSLEPAEPMKLVLILFLVWHYIGFWSFKKTSAGNSCDRGDFISCFMVFYSGALSEDASIQFFKSLS